MAIASHAQVKVDKFILPDGREITADKLDSVKKAWNDERISFRHNNEDDKKHVMHLVRMTPELERELQDADVKRRKAIKAMIERPAPDFSLKDMEGKTWKLSGLKGKVVVLNFWFTSCPPCDTEMPELNRLVKTYGDKNVVFLGLTFNERNIVTDFLKTKHFAYSILPSSGKVDQAYQVSSWPTSFVIDRNGNIALAANYEKDIFKTLSVQIDQLL